MSARAPLHLVVVPHTHWDREWYRTHEAFRLRLLGLVDDLLDLLEGDPAFRHFTLDGQSIVVDDYLAVRPEARERIAKLVEAGRLLVGPWTVLPDEWLVSGEALIRNLRAGLARADALGGAMRVGYVPDQFGHVGQLPQIFAGFGFETAVLWRGVGADVRETLFEWEAPDGTRLFSVYLARSYSNAAHPPAEPEALVEFLSEEVRALARRSPVPSLLLMNGTDHAEPQPRLPELLREAAARLPEVGSVEIGTLPAFAARARAELQTPLAVHRGEFRSGLRAPLLPGCASARMPQKRADFENDRLLVRYLEPLAAWLGSVGGRADLGLIDFLWRIALQNHPHDSICGCSIDRVHEQMETRFQRVAELGTAECERVFGALARRVAAPEGGGPCLVVWNPGAAGPTPIEAELELDDELAAAGVGVVDAQGRCLPSDAQLLEPAADLLSLQLPAGFARSFVLRDMPDLFACRVQDVSWEREGARVRLRLHLGRRERCDADLDAKRAALRELLRDAGVETVELRARRRARVGLRFADDLPAWGLRAYRVAPGRAPRAPALARERLPGGGFAIANEGWRVEVQGDGRVDLTRCAEGEGAQRVEDALRLVSEGDRGDEYNFDPVPEGVVVERPERVRVGAELGRVSAAVRVRARYRVPQSLAPDRRRRSARSASLPAEIELRLWAGVDRVDVRVALENRARDHRLRLHLGAPFRAERFQVESAFELADRPLEAEEPGAEGRLPAERPIGTVPERSFAAIAGGGAAVTVANRGLAEVEAVARPDGRSELAVTLLRAVGWLSRDDLVLRPAHAGPPLETPGAQVPGPHRGELSIRWHAQDAPGRSAEAHRFAYPPLCLQRGRPAPGEAPVVADGAQLLATDDPELVVSAIEPRPEGRALVRVYNSSPEARRARLVWGGPGRASLEAVDLAERPAGGVVAGEGEDGVEIALRPWQIASLRTR